MSTLYIREHASQGRDLAGYGMAGVPAYPSVAEQTVPISGVSAQSAAFNASTRMLVVCSDVVCSIAVGASPTATTTSWRMPANTSTNISVPAGATYKLAVIANT